MASMETPTNPLHIVIVGAGMAGLSAAYTLGHAGHKITVLEAAQQLTEIGAGIQLIPSVVKLLSRWGLDDQLAKLAISSKSITHRRYKDGKRLGWVGLAKFKQDYGHPFIQVHRTDLQNMLLEIATPYMDLRLGARVVTIDPEAPSVTLESGEVVSGDMILGADGIKSIIREVVVGKVDKPISTGDAAFRAIIETSKMMDDPELKQLVDDADVNVWMGPGGHIVAYCLRGKELYNLVLLHVATYDGLEESYDTEGSVKKMKEFYGGWEPRVQKLTNLVDKTLIWPLKDRDPLAQWVHPSGKVTLIGDAVHPMLPYRGSGAGMAIEDAAVLGRLFTHVHHPSQIPSTLLGYQHLRHPRTADVQLASRALREFNHYPDGPEQEARDAKMVEAMEAALAEERGEVNTWAGNDKNLWANRKKNDEQYGYDSDAVADAWWAEHGLQT
ncbi:hypothetical protein DL96DRAFT_1703549 [Flagelloscypha sp. PMI_526]|nr:hypothetical protein DL96DRAFT_1703549 [Flagelloscypha sp. PMI_526]